MAKLDKNPENLYYYDIKSDKFSELVPSDIVFAKWREEQETLKVNNDTDNRCADIFFTDSFRLEHDISRPSILVFEKEYTSNGDFYDNSRALYNLIDLPLLQFRKGNVSNIFYSMSSNLNTDIGAKLNETLDHLGKLSQRIDEIDETLDNLVTLSRKQQQSIDMLAHSTEWLALVFTNQGRDISELKTAFSQLQAAIDNGQDWLFPGVKGKPKDQIVATHPHYNSESIPDKIDGIEDNQP